MVVLDNKEECYRAEGKRSTRWVGLFSRLHVLWGCVMKKQVGDIRSKAANQIGKRSWTSWSLIKNVSPGVTWFVLLSANLIYFSRRLVGVVRWKNFAELNEMKRVLIVRGIRLSCKCIAEFQLTKFRMDKVKRTDVNFTSWEQVVIIKTVSASNEI